MKKKMFLKYFHNHAFSPTSSTSTFFLLSVLCKKKKHDALRTQMKNSSNKNDNGKKNGFILITNTNFKLLLVAKKLYLYIIHLHVYLLSAHWNKLIDTIILYYMQMSKSLKEHVSLSFIQKKRKLEFMTVKKPQHIQNLHTLLSSFSSSTSTAKQNLWKILCITDYRLYTSLMSQARSPFFCVYYTLY